MADYVPELMLAVVLSVPIVAWVVQAIKLRRALRRPADPAPRALPPHPWWGSAEVGIISKPLPGGVGYAHVPGAECGYWCQSCGRNSWFRTGDPAPRSCPKCDYTGLGWDYDSRKWPGWHDGGGRGDDVS